MTSGSRRGRRPPGRTDPQITVTTSEGTTPPLIRALHAGSLDLAVLMSRPPHRPFDGDSPRLHVEIVADTELVVAVPSTEEFGRRSTMHVDELVAAAWIAAPSSSSESLLGVWPGLPGRPRIIHSARDWLTKLQLGAGGFGVTTVPSGLSPVLPPGVSLLRVDGAPPRSVGCSWHVSPAAPPQPSRPSPERSLRPLEPPPRPRTIACAHVLLTGGHRGRRWPVLRRGFRGW
ncbi:LysR substrate-binding domain-containing protein [Streptomyces kronopolitis]|uniref:LysR substrate-binding domain-containing protein n=1 Tax=Streptomyces kronopolitis TaxID=1612435 RepID=UPI0036CFD3A5